MPDYKFIVTLTAPNDYAANLYHDQIRSLIAESYAAGGFGAGVRIDISGGEFDEERHEYVRTLAEDYTREGELEIDDGAIVSEGDDNGAYVQSWTWVSFDGTDLDKENEPEDPDEIIVEE